MTTAPPRVAVVCPTRRIPALAPGGASHHLRAIAGGFVRAGAEVELWAARRSRSGAPIAPPPPGVTVWEARRGRLPGTLRKLRRLDERADAVAMARQAGRQADRFCPTVIYERHALFASIGARLRRRTGAPWVLEVNAPAAWEAVWFEGLAPSPSLLRAESQALRGADVVAVVSEPLRDYVLRRGVAPGRVVLLPNGSDTPARAPRAPDERFVLGYAGTFKPWQALRAASEELLALARSVAPRRFVIEAWGDGPDREAFVAAASAAGLHVDWRGWGDPVRAAWDAAWVPLGAWPPPGPRLDEAVPERYFCPLKAADAAAAGLPVFTDGQLRPPAPPPPSWRDVAGTILRASGVERGKMSAAG